jgi:predicted permease
MSFSISFANVCIALFYLIPGFILAKMKKVKTEHLSTLSAVLIYGCGPFLVIHSLLDLDFSFQNLKNMALFFIASLLLQVIFLVVVFLLLRKKYHINKYRMFNIGSMMGNVGFFGLPIVRGLLPNNLEAACYSAVFTVSMNLLVFTMGIFALTQDKKYISVKSAFCNPTMLGLVIGLPLHIFGVGAHLPDVLLNGVELLADMTMPLCMTILGIRLANVVFHKLFTRPFVYVICAGKLLLFPLFCYGIVSLFPFFDYAFRASMLILAGTPCAVIIFNLAEIHHKDEELAANCVLVSTLLCVLTIPLLTLIL